MKTIRMIAPAKVNLFLGVGDRRGDGYHNVTTVMHTLSMHDTLQMYLMGCGEEVSIMEQNDPAQPLRQAYVKVDPDQGLKVSARNLWHNGIEPLDIPSKDNLACRAIHVLAEELGRREDETVRIVIEKHIPYQAGLGGGSTDAAAALLGIASMWDIPLDDPSIERAAQRLGADVCFFIHGGCSLLEGKGDIFCHQLDVRRDAVVVIRPNGGVSTRKAYELFDEDPHYFDDETISSVRLSKQAIDVTLGNNLQDPARKILPVIVDVEGLAKSFDGVRDVLLCGSGSAIFAVCESYVVAQALASEASRCGYWARTTTFSGICATTLPERRWR